jgi:hypothetical protein
MECIMQAVTTLSKETMAELGILASAEMHSTRDADKFGIELAGPEHDDVDPSDFFEVNHD